MQSPERGFLLAAHNNVKAALAAGMRVLGYTASVGLEAIVNAGAEPIDDLADIPLRLGLSPSAIAT